MKVCPVCKTTLFEDMEVCYGCLYRFGSEPALEKAASNLEEAAPLREGDMRRWAVRLEVRSLSDPDQVWAAELIPPYEVHRWEPRHRRCAVAGRVLLASRGRCGRRLRCRRLGGELGEELLRLGLEAVVDGDVGVEDATALLGELASVGTVSVQQLDVEGGFGVLDDAPCLAVGHAHVLRGGVERAVGAHSQAEVGNAAAEDGGALGKGVSYGESNARLELVKLVHGESLRSGGS